MPFVRNTTGYVVITTLVFVGVFVMILYSLLGLVFTQYERQRQIQRSKESLQIAEAGMRWYRWYLAHNPQDINGPDNNEPFEKSITDPERGKIGTAKLNISGSEYCGQVQSVDIKSTGWSEVNPDVQRKIRARYTRPSVAQYAYILNSNVWVGADRTIRGPYHSNGGIRMDGTSNSVVQSAQKEWECGEEFGCSEDEESTTVRDVIVGETDSGDGQLSTSDDVLAVGPKKVDLSGDGSDDVPYVDSNGRIRITDESDVPETLASDSDISGSIESSKTRLWAGYWNQNNASVYFVNQNNDTIYRVDTDGQVVTVASPADGAQAISGAGDIDNDGLYELVFADGSQQLRYLEPSGTVKKLENGQLGSNNGIGAGEISSFENIAGSDVVVGVDGSNNIKIVNESGVTVVSNGDAAKSPVSVVDVDSDGNQEVVYVTTGGILHYIDNVGSGNDVKTLRDSDGDTISGSGATGITSSTDGGSSSDDDGTQTKPGVFGSGEDEDLWKYPVPTVDFAGITLDLEDIRNQSKQDGLYFGSFGGQSNRHGWHIVFKGDGTVDVYRVQDTDRVIAYSSQKGWHYNYNIIAKERLQGNYELPESCPVIYAADKVWIEGVVDQKVTVAAAKTQNANYNASIIFNDNLTYEDEDSQPAGLTAIAEQSVFVPLQSPNNMKLNGIFIAQEGHFGRDHYRDAYLSEQNDKYIKRDQLTINGTVVSNGRVGTKWVNDDGDYLSGYADRVNSYDRDQAINPPPLTPFVSKNYELIRWQEINQ